MRLVKIEDIILNMDHVAVIKGRKQGAEYGGGIGVYAYTAYGKEIFLGTCENREEYKELIEMVYKDFGKYFIGEIVQEEEEEPFTEELWK